MSENFKKILLYLRIVMPILFILIGIYCIIFPERIKLQAGLSGIIGYLILAYGLFRGYRAYKDLKRG